MACDPFQLKRIKPACVYQSKAKSSVSELADCIEKRRKIILIIPHRDILLFFEKRKKLRGFIGLNRFLYFLIFVFHPTSNL
jgi:hypothetical protein